MTDSIADFNAFRSRMNDLIQDAGNLTINRFFNLDHRAYEPGALGTKTKEMLGLVSSLVLRCDDCVTYHVIRCHEEGVTREEFLDVFAVGLVVGGSIVIPHLRRAMARLEELVQERTARLVSQTSAGPWARVLGYVEAWVDHYDSARRSKFAARVLVDLFAARIGHGRAALLLREVTARQKGGWLLKDIKRTLARLGA